MTTIESKLIFKTNKENHDYLMLKVRPDLGYFLSSTKLPQEVFEELKIMNGNLSTYEKENNISYYQGAVALRKDSLIGNWLIENSNSDIITNKDEVITQKKVQNALLIALYDGNEKMTNRINSLFQERVEGTRADLLTDRNEKALDYILNNTSIDEHLKKVDEEESGKFYDEEPKEYVVYEDYKYIKRPLKEEKIKVKRRIEND